MPADAAAAIAIVAVGVVSVELIVKENRFRKRSGSSCCVPIDRKVVFARGQTFQCGVSGECEKWFGIKAVVQPACWARHNHIKRNVCCNPSFTI